MCDKCVEAVKRHYPDLPEKHYGDLLMGATCFPFGSPEQVEQQLVELREKTDGTLSGALAFAERQMDESMSAYKKTNPDTEPGLAEGEK